MFRNTAATLKALKVLCEAASREADREGLFEIGAEHFLLAAFDLPDGGAGRIFGRFNLDAEGLRAAIERQQAEALAFAGFAADAMPGPVPITRRNRGFTLPANASGRVLLERLSRAGPASEVLSGALVILAAVEAQRGVVPRVLQNLGVTPEALAAAAHAERDARNPL